MLALEWVPESVQELDLVLDLAWDLESVLVLGLVLVLELDPG